MVLYVKIRIIGKCDKVVDYLFWFYFLSVMDEFNVFFIMIGWVNVNKIREKILVYYLIYYI